MSKYTMRVAINGSETDDTVLGDDSEWFCKVGSVQITEGGGGWFRQGDNPLCTFTVQLPIQWADRVHKITVAVQGNVGAGGLYPLSWHHVSGDTYYAIVFHGYVVDVQTDGIQKGFIKYSAVSEMQGLYERRAHLAADTNSGPRELCNDIEAAHGLTIGNATLVPAVGTFYSMDRPKQGPGANGDMLRTATACLGMTILGEWEGTLASPDLLWRPDYNWSSDVTYYNKLGFWRPWEYEYADVGMVYSDFVAEVEVTGETGNSIFHYGYQLTVGPWGQPVQPPKIVDVRNGTRYWGTARLADAGMRRNVGNQTLSIASWIDTAANCEDAAQRLLKHVGEPTHLNMRRVCYYPDQLWYAANADADFTYDVDDYGMDHACVKIGDTIQSRGFTGDGASFDDSNGLGDINDGGFWPDHCPVDGDTYNDLHVLWNNALSNGEDASLNVTSYYTIRAIRREWTPAAGWKMDLNLEHDNTVPVPDTDHGTDS